MNFYGEKCVILCSYIVHMLKFLKCYNNAFFKVLCFLKKKKKVNHNIGQLLLFLGNDFGNISFTVNIHYSQSENPRHFSQKTCSFFG